MPEMPAGPGHHYVGTQSRVGARPQGTLLSVRKNVRPNSRRTRLEKHSVFPRVSRDCPFISMRVSNSQISAMGAIRFSEAEFGSLSKREVLVRSPSQHRRSRGLGSFPVHAKIRSGSSNGIRTLASHPKLPGKITAALRAGCLSSLGARLAGLLAQET
jgi:hypothetical protein